MIKKRTVVYAALVLLICFLTACTSTPATVIQMELTSDYATADPFINARLFYVSDDAKSVDFEVDFKMKSESCLLEIADNETEEVIWSKAWKESADEKFNISLNELSKDKECVIRLTSTKVEHVKLVMTSDSSLVKEREQPRRPARG